MYRNLSSQKRYLSCEQVHSPGPFLELFARSSRVGWSQWGDKVEEPMPLRLVEG